MATANVHSECLRLQAECAVRAYHALRNAPKGSNFQSDDFPVGRFAEFATQIKALDGSLEPEQGSAGDELRVGDDAAETNIEIALRAIDEARKALKGN
jgi:hypothetical protein